MIPWWQLLPQGVSAAIKRRAGHEPFKELAKKGPLPLGTAVLTGAGRLPYRGIIHVAGISMLWRSSEASIRNSTTNALLLAEAQGFESIALPLIGAGTGGGDGPTVERFIAEQARASPFSGRVVVVRYAPRKSHPK